MSQARGRPQARRTLAQCEQENAVLKERIRGQTRRVIAQNLGLIFRQLTLLGMVFLIARYFYLSAEALAGQETIANFGLGFIAKLEFSIKALSAATIAAILWALLERGLKGNTIKQLSGEKERLELLLDPNRSSSNLTGTGRTNPQDV
jgi:hypothetical protein